MGQSVRLADVPRATLQPTLRKFLQQAGCRYRCIHANLERIKQYCSLAVAKKSEAAIRLSLPKGEGRVRVSSLVGGARKPLNPLPLRMGEVEQPPARGYSIT
jgi:hypothetical protein